MIILLIWYSHSYYLYHYNKVDYEVLAINRVVIAKKKLFGLVSSITWRLDSPAKEPTVRTLNNASLKTTIGISLYLHPTKKNRDDKEKICVNIEEEARCLSLSFRT